VTDTQRYTNLAGT